MRRNSTHIKKNYWLDPHKTWDSEARDLLEYVRHRRLRIATPAFFLFLLVVLGSAGRALTILALTYAALFLLWMRRLERHPNRRGVPVGWREGWAFFRRRRRVVLGWEVGCETLNFQGKRGVMRGRVPVLHDVHLTDDGSVGASTRCGRLGVTPDMLREAAPKIAHALEVREVEVGDLRPGWATLVFRDGDALARPVTPSSMPAFVQPAQRGEYVPPSIPVGLSPRGDAVPISLATSVLIGGATGAGKSSVDWTLLAYLIQQRIPVRVRVGDPAGGVEFALLKEFMGRSQSDLFTVHRYAETPAEVRDLIREQASAMRCRLRSMSGATRWHQPTEEEPLDLLLIDELLRVPDLKKAAEGDLGEVLTIGRKAGFLVWANVQVAKVSTIGDARDMFAQRVCLRVQTRENVVSVLGDPHSPIEAPAFTIPKTMPGTGFVYDDSRGSYAKFRAPYLNDLACRQVAQGLLPAGMDGREPRERTALYRWYAADEDPRQARPRYIGVSYDVLQREAQHVAGLREFMEGDVRRTTEWFPDRASALRAERHAIESERPLFNVQHARRRRRVAAA